MKKIVINLSPQKEKITSTILQNMVSYTPLVGVTTGFVLIPILLLQLFIFRQTYEYKNYSGRWKKWENKYNSIKRIKEEISRLKEEKERIEEVVTPEYDIVLILSDVFSSLPKNVWFKELTFKKGSINLKGYVVRWNEDYLISLDRFINSLREKEYFVSRFSKVNIKESKKSTFNGLETTKFIIECRK